MKVCADFIRINEQQRKRRKAKESLISQSALLGDGD